MQTFETHWRGHPLTIRYDIETAPEPGRHALLELESPLPLPVHSPSETVAALVEEQGGPVPYVLAWLDDNAMEQEGWQDPAHDWRQASLF